MAKIQSKEMKEVEKIIERHGSRPDDVVAILQDLQAAKGYLSEEALTYISEKLEIPLSKIYSLTTFYRAFSLKPRGKHLIKVCTGTTCHVRGGVEILDEIERIVGIKPGETAKDLTFSLETVNCLGACALGPLMVIDKQYFGEMTREKVAPILEKFTKK